MGGPYNGRQLPLFPPQFQPPAWLRFYVTYPFGAPCGQQMLIQTWVVGLHAQALRQAAAAAAMPSEAPGAGEGSDVYREGTTDPTCPWEWSLKGR